MEVNMASIPIADLAKLLSSAGKREVTEDDLRADIEAGAPVNADGTINLVHYAGWVLGELEG